MISKVIFCTAVSGQYSPIFKMWVNFQAQLTVVYCAVIWFPRKHHKTKQNKKKTSHTSRCPSPNRRSDALMASSVHGVTFLQRIQQSREWNKNMFQNLLHHPENTLGRSLPNRVQGVPTWKPLILLHLTGIHFMSLPRMHWEGWSVQLRYSI